MVFSTIVMDDFTEYFGTSVYGIIRDTGEIYKEIDIKQKEWKKSSPAQCPRGCGKCCHNFEPDLFESEALYMAAWILKNQPEKAEALINGTFTPYRQDSNLPENGCILYDPDTEYHCTVYEGRSFICRLFGYSGDRNKNGKIRWVPCKFIPEKMLSGKFRHRQYTQEEIQEELGILPPVMQDLMGQVPSLTPDNTTTEPLRTALPKAIKKLKLLLSFTVPPEPNSPAPTTPSAA